MHGDPTAARTSAALAAFAVAPGNPPLDRSLLVGRIVVDTVGSALAATGEMAQQIVARWSARERTTGRSTVWSTGERVSATLAATVNGHAAHILDWDDVSPTMPMHPSCVLMPALLAVAESRALPGSAIVGAHDVGASAFRAIAEVLPHDRHYERGWHTTSTVGRLAATAALANLCGLDQERATHALGIAASSAAGSLANFGSMTKAWHSGQAARDAIIAVELAEDGFSSRLTQLEDRRGFFAMYGESSRQNGLGGLLEHWRTSWPSDWAVKRHPTCYATHRSIDAALALRAELGRGDVVRVTVEVAPGELRPLNSDSPTNGTEAKFSMAYVVATALVHGEVRLQHFDDDAIQDPRVRRLMPLIEVTETTTPAEGRSSNNFAVVTVHQRGGAIVRRRVDQTYGDSSDPLAESDLVAKFTDGSAKAGVEADMAVTWAGHLFDLPQSRAACRVVPGPVSTLIQRRAQ